MERKSIPVAENRLLILYAISKLEPVTDLQLLEFMLEYDLMDYFTLQLGLADMEDQGQLAGKAHPLDRLLSITRDGEYALSSFLGHIPISRRDLIDRQAPRWRQRFRMEQQTPAEVSVLPDDLREYRMRLMEKDATMMEIVIVRPASRPINRLQEKWRGIAQETYRAVNETLMHDFNENAPPPENPAGEAVVEREAAGEWKLRLQCGEMSLTVCLPDERLALWCAAVEPEKCVALKKRILRWLDTPEE